MTQLDIIIGPEIEGDLPATALWDQTGNFIDWVVGTYLVGQLGDPNTTTHSYAGWDSKHIWGIDVPGAVSTEIYDLTDSSEVVGTFQDAAGHSHGFIDLRGRFDQIDIPGATDTFIYGMTLDKWSEHIFYRSMTLIS